jgi:hypothetical protein
MSLRSRQRSSRPSEAPSRSGRPSEAPSRAGTLADSNPLPAYEEPQYPLNDAAQAELQTLILQSTQFKGIKNQIDRAGKILADSIGDLNARGFEYGELMDDRRERRRKRGEPDDDEAAEKERQYDILKKNIEDQTKRMDKELQKLLDIDAMNSGRKAALTDGGNEVNQLTRQANIAAQSTQESPETQAASQRNIRIYSPVSVVGREVEQQADQWFRKSKTER